VRDRRFGSPEDKSSGRRDAPAAVFHNHGRYLRPYTNRGSAYFGILSRRLFRDSSKRGRFRKPDELEIVLCHNYDSKPIAVQSLDYLGIRDYVELGRDVQPWTNRAKIALVLDHLERGCNAEYVLFLDAIDVILTADPARMLRCFREEFDCGVLFNASKDSFPGSAERQTAVLGYLQQPGCRNNPHNVEVVSESDIGKCASAEAFEVANYEGPFCHFNAGCYIGRRDDVVAMLREAKSLGPWFDTERYRSDDQGVLREVHRRNFPRCQIDSKCRIFQTLCNIELSELASERPVTYFEECLYRLGAAAGAFFGRLRFRVHELWMTRRS